MKIFDRLDINCGRCWQVKIPMENESVNIELGLNNKKPYRSIHITLQIIGKWKENDC